MTINQLFFITMGIILSLSLTAQFLLPWPYGMLASLGVLFGVVFVLSRLAGSESSPGPLARHLYNVGKRTDNVSIKYICLVCNMEHNKRECPRCGSTIMKTVFPKNDNVE